MFEEVKPNRVVICSDSSGALTSIHEMQSDARHDILLYIAQTIHTTKRPRVDIYIFVVTCTYWGGGKWATKRGVVCMNV